MKLHKYKNNEEYLNTQVNGNKNKISYTWVDKETIEMICDYIIENIPQAQFGICHGTRRGNEQKWFKEILNINVIGTEISPTANEFPDTIQWDFHKIKDEWINNVDFIYSNSFDHSYDPELCLSQWMKCIKTTGICFIEWTKKHDEIGFNKLDCFAASKDEYIEIINKKYNIKDMLHRKTERHGDHYIFVITHKEDIHENIY